ncbi:hypothetical protein SteCoe_21653 [Stentor coeruleus]|uniref:Receptor expression-enhancing protein n=1 Tax=Stentor coeruleus TaxID=5963 RepID=A0A1R2BP65_9CILI|nr:hypothetical protein SteCoe_21653 [Stentor coeruleus]
MDIFTESIDEIYRTSRNWKILRYISTKFGTHPGKIVIYIGFICLFLMMIGVYEKFICDVLTFYFPAKWTLRSIVIPNFASSKLWVSYWIVYSLLKLLDETIPFLIQFIPFYYAIKCMFLMVLYAPKIRGGLIIYDNVFFQLVKDIKGRDSK